MTFSFYGERLEGFLTMARPGSWPANTPLNWIRSVGIDDLSRQVSDSVMTRTYLKDASSDPRVSDRDLLWSILAWGGMRRDAARRLAKHEKPWAALVGFLRNTRPTRKESYAACASLMSLHHPSGIGPAYYTKLIFFANPRHDGYIMDQWTSRSVNFLLMNDNLVRMRTPYHVDPRNTPESYERFCRVIEALAQHTPSKSPEEVEQCLFSTGGKNPDPWRRYLLANRG